MRLTIVYNNYVKKGELEEGWGMGAYVEVDGKKILFDTGDNGRKLLQNLNVLNIDLSQIDAIAISHDHYDHTGGLADILMVKSNVKVYLLRSFSEDTKDLVRESGAELIEVVGPTKISEHVYLTGEMGTVIKEEALVVDTDSGLVIITGCSHPGVQNLAKKAKEITGKDEVYLVTGGFHLLNATESEIREIADDLKKLGVRKIGPSHCSGDLARKIMKEMWKDDFMDLRAGETLIIP